MTERISQEKADALIEVLLDGTLTRKGLTDLADEFFRARRVEAEQAREICMMGDRIHALEVQQTELIRHSKEQAKTIERLTSALRRVQRAAVNERVWNEDEGRIDDMQKVVGDALKAVGL